MHGLSATPIRPSCRRFNHTDGALEHLGDPVPISAQSSPFTTQSGPKGCATLAGPAAMAPGACPVRRVTGWRSAPQPVGAHDGSNAFGPPDAVGPVSVANDASRTSTGQFFTRSAAGLTSQRVTGQPRHRARITEVGVSAAGWAGPARCRPTRWHDGSSGIGAWEFSHSLIAEACYTSSGLPRRIRLHRDGTSSTSSPQRRRGRDSCRRLGVGGHLPGVARGLRIVQRTTLREDRHRCVVGAMVWATLMGWEPDSV
jgi:hypothetical protein